MGNPCLSEIERKCYLMIDQSSWNALLYSAEMIATQSNPGGYAQKAKVVTYPSATLVRPIVDQEG